MSKYIGGGEDANEKRKLNKLGGTDWEKARTRAKKAVKDLAKGLIQLLRPAAAAARLRLSPPDSPWQKEFEDEFEYAETDDQLRCIDEIKRDMEQPRPMDRLLCGDVGYGKTEVAFRAIMKCVLDGKQARHPGAHHRPGPAALPHRKAAALPSTRWTSTWSAASAPPPR